ncbi:MAG: methyltransferase domain-containing protein [Magnetococcales bacterium]|nr:methyltransferase domain-containing protein [Magnetococcales bacterium]
MDQTRAHENHNPDLLRLIPETATNLIEIGCSSGALAREYKKLHPNCNYFGVDVDSKYVQMAGRYCDETLVADIETVDNSFFTQHKHRDCWVFGDTLEHLKNPWDVLQSIRGVIPSRGAVVACLPNAQHWSLQVRLSIGDFRYEESGLLDRTHLRWFTRETLQRLFLESGYNKVECFPRIFNEPAKNKFIPLIGEMAKTAGFDPNVAINDALPLQYIIRATPG